MRRRRKGEQPGSDPAGPEQPAVPEGPVAPAPRGHGPWDDSELPVDPDDQTRAHLGALSVQGNPQVELRLQVDETSQTVTAVMLVAQDGAMELRVFAAPRHEDLWADIRPQLAAEAVRRGGRAGEVEGPYGTALHLVVPVAGPEGQQVTQPSTVLGIAGPRWLLRVSMFGRPATEFRPDAPLEATLRSVVVHRGTEPRPPGEALALVLPAGATRAPSSGPAAPPAPS